MKTEPMEQQATALERLDGKWFYALFMEQGTGKTWVYLADAQRYFRRGKVDGLFVLAPNGVHTNWVRREIPTHVEDDEIVAVAWTNKATGARKKFLDAILKPYPGRLRVLTMNYEALATSKDARAHARRFLESGRMLFDLDESQKIKNPQAAITKALMRPPHRDARSLRDLSIARRIGTGTPMDKPADIFSQFEFMEPGLLGTSNFRAFMAEFSVLADWKDPKTDADWAFKRQVEANPRMQFATIIARDEVTGQPMYRNLDKLNRLVAKHSYRVLKKDCMELPPKVYSSVYFELTPAQRAAYELMENELRILVEEGGDRELVSVHALSKLVKLQQITSGYVVVPGRDELLYVGDKNPRVAAVVDYVEENVDGSVIIWAKFREEVRALAEALAQAGRKVVEYHGDVKEAAREEAIDALQSGRADTFVGVQKAGGTGLTLTKATKTIYCSNEHSAILRAQSEDRNHRKGTKEIVEAEGGEYAVVYIDVVATDTVDEGITRAHQFKMDVAEQILGSRGIDLRGFL